MPNKFGDMPLDRDRPAEPEGFGDVDSTVRQEAPRSEFGDIMVTDTHMDQPAPEAPAARDISQLDLANLNESQQAALTELQSRGIVPTSPEAMVTGTDEMGVLDYLMGTAEVAGTMITGAIAEPVSGMLGLAKTITTGPDEAKKSIEQIQEALTYMPKTEGGEAVASEIGSLLGPIVEYLGKIPKGAGDIGAKIAGPAGGAAGVTLVAAIPELLGLKGTRAAKKLGLKRLLKDKDLSQIYDEAGSIRPQIKTAADKAGIDVANVVEEIATEGDVAETVGRFKKLPSEQIAAEVKPSQEILDAAAEFGVSEKLIPSHYSKNPTYRAIEQGLKQVPGSKLAAKEVALIEDLGRRADDLIEEFGGVTDKSMLSDSYRLKSERVIDSLETESSGLYSKVDEAIKKPSKAEVMPKKINAVPIMEKSDLINFLDDIDLEGGESIGTRGLHKTEMDSKDLSESFSTIDDFETEMLPGTSVYGASDPDELIESLDFFIKEAKQHGDSDYVAIVKGRDLGTDVELNDVGENLFSDAEVVAYVPRKDAPIIGKKPTTVEVNNTTDYIESIIKDLGGKEYLSPVEKKIYKSLKEEPTYSRLERIRREVGQGLNRGSGPFKDAEQGSLKQLYRALAEDQKAAAYGFGDDVGNMYETANSLVATRKGIEKQLIKTLGKDIRGAITTRAKKAMLDLPKGDTKAFDDLVENVPKQLGKETRQQVIATALNDAFIGGSRAEKSLNIPAFDDFMNGIKRNKGSYKRLKKEIGPESMERLEKFHTLVSGVRGAQKSAITTGRSALVPNIFDESTGIAAKLYGQGGGILPGIVSKVSGAPGAGAVAQLAQSAIKRTPRSVAADELLSSPKFVGAIERAARGADKLDIEKRIKEIPAYKRWTKTLTESDAAELASVGVTGYLTGETIESD